MVVEKLRDQAGNLAPTLQSILQQGVFTDEIDREIDRCVDDLIEHDVILGKLNTNNLVYTWDEANGPRFVIVDGYGSKYFIPIYSMSKVLNALNNRRLLWALRNGIKKQIEQRRAMVSNDLASAPEEILSAAPTVPQIELSSASLPPASGPGRPRPGLDHRAPTRGGSRRIRAAPGGNPKTF